MKVTCACCRYFSPRSAGHPRNECRRHSPAPRLTCDGRHDEFGIGVWPIVSAEGWCGEFKRRVAIYQAVQKADVKMQVVQNYRFTSRILTVKKAIKDGHIGEPNYIMARFATDYRRRGAWGMFRHEIPHSLLVEGAVHHFDQIRNLAESDCQTISGWEWNPGHPSFDGECCGTYVMRMTNGLFAH